MDILAELRRALAEVRARMGGGRKAQKKKKVRAPGRPAKTGRKTGCGTGAGGFGEGNNCAKEDGIPNRPLRAGGALKMPNVKQLKKEVAQEKAAAAAAAAKQRRKEIQAKKKAAIARKQAKDQKASAEKQALDAARAKKREAMLQKIRIKKANEKVSVVGTPKSVKEQLDEAKAAMKTKTAEASKQLTVAGTPKSLKQEIDEAKARQASGALKVAGTPKSIKEELDELKARIAAEKKAKAEVKKAEKEPPKPSVSTGSSLLTERNKLSSDQKAAAERDESLLFGEHLKDGWKYSYGGANSDKIREAQKKAISIEAARRMDALGIKESDVDDEILEILGKNYLATALSPKAELLSGVPKGYERRYALSAAMVHNWAETSGKGQRAIGIQMAIRDLFGIKKAHMMRLNNQLKKIPAWQVNAEKVRTHRAVRAALRAQYDATQADLKSKGIKELTLVRGYKSSVRIDQSGQQNVSLQPASSFSTRKETADKFAGSGKTARRLTITVPAERVFSMCTTGFGCMFEQEITVLGGMVTGRLVGSSIKW